MIGRMNRKGREKIGKGIGKNRSEEREKRVRRERGWRDEFIPWASVGVKSPYR